MTRKKVVLYLDDNPAYLQLMRFIINCQQNVKVLLASSTKDAMKQIDVHAPDLIFINLQFQQQPFREFVNKLRKRQADIPMIGLSRELLSDQQKQNFGLDDYVESRLNVDAILALLDKYPLREEAAIS